MYGEHQSHLSHEVIAGGVGFEAMKKWEDHQRSKGAKLLADLNDLSHIRAGETVNHSFAKELLVGFAGAEMDKLAETRGMDMVDRERAKHDAKKQAQHLYDQQYSDMDNYDP